MKGSELKQYAKDRGLKTSEVAYKMQVSERTVYGWYNSKEVKLIVERAFKAVFK